MLTDFEVNPDQQMPMPFKAADDYAHRVMGWARLFDPAAVRVRRDVQYGPHPLHRYNVFSPMHAVNVPVVIFWHGGGWTNGYRDYNTFMARHITAIGCVLVSPSYRLVTHARFPAALDDCMATLAHVREHISDCSGDPSRIYLGGHSAGAHLAALTALRSPITVQGCLAISGIMDLYHPSPTPGSLEERVYSMVLSDPSQDAVMSPVCWATGNRVPFDLTIGEYDSPRVRSSNLRLFELLKLQAARVELHDLPGLDHFQTHTGLCDGNAGWYQRLKQQIVENAR